MRSLAREDRPIRLLMTTPRVGEGSLEIVQVTHERRIRSFAIITTTPNELCAELHNRMPVGLKTRCMAGLARRIHSRLCLGRGDFLPIPGEPLRVAAAMILSRLSDKGGLRPPLNLFG